MIKKINEWKRPVIVPRPLFTDGVSQPVLSLSGKWEFKRDVNGEFWLDIAGTGDWDEVSVPGDVSIESFDGNEGIVSEKEFAYRKIIKVPAEYKGKKVILRFEGANGFTRVWIDGNFVMEHYGSYTTWDCDITGYVTPGRESVLTLGVTNTHKEINPENKGGLVRDVKLIALPHIHITRLHVETEFDEEFKDAVLRVFTGTSCTGDEESELCLELVSPDGEQVPLDNHVIKLNGDCPGKVSEFSIKSPAKWDAEHPHLYTLKAALRINGKTVEKIEKRVGFRQITVSGKRVYVNGKEIKLRGICRHEISPYNGRSLTPEMEKKDVELFKEANINYVKTFYPASEYFLDLCDEAGIYVQEGTAAYVDQLVAITQNDPAFYEKHIGQFAEMVERDRSHPCVIIWPLGSECAWGYNFSKILEYVKKEDDTRPVLFSFPMSMPDENRPTDIWSVHYIDYRLNLAEKFDQMIIFHTHGSDSPPGYALGYAFGKDRPVLHDEYAHVPCYNRDEHMRDPSVRNFWGESIKRFWDKIWNTDGALGGAIMCGIDDVVFVKDGIYSCKEWGIIDVWRRKKPEHWLVRQAYSPVRIEKTEYEIPAGKELGIEIENRFNHTNLDEVTIEWKAGKESGIINDFNLEPRCKGILKIPARDLKQGDIISLQFTDPSGLKVSEFELKVSPKENKLPVLSGTAPTIEEDSEVIKIKGRQFELIFDKVTGLVKSGRVNGTVLIKGGPFLNMEGLRLGDWQLDGISASRADNRATVTIKGNYGGDVWVTFDIHIDSEGLMITEYRVDRINKAMPRTVKIYIGLDCGGLDEIGVYYLLNGELDTLSWDRKALWSAYPDWHIGRGSGNCLKYSADQARKFGEKPETSWSQDVKNHALYGKYDIGLRGTNDFRSSKNNIYNASVSKEGEETRVTVLSDGRDSVRLELLPDPAAMIDDRDPSIKYVGTWYAINDESGSYLNTETCSDTPGDYVEYEFYGTGICWIGPTDMIGGKANVYIDGELVAEGVSQYVESVEKLGMSRGYEKRYQRILFSIDGLERGKHTLRIKVTGEKEAEANYAYVIIDAFRVLGGPDDDGIKLIINNDYNFTRLAWGNYVREPINVYDGYSNKVYMKLS